MGVMSIMKFCKSKTINEQTQVLNKSKKGLIISIFALSLVLSWNKNASADISGLTLCGFSKAFTKRKNQEIKELQKRMKKYDADSAPTIALKATMERTEKRFDFYAKSGLLCGTDGLPHLIADPGFAIKNSIHFGLINQFNKLDISLSY